MSSTYLTVVSLGVGLLGSGLVAGCGGATTASSLQAQPESVVAAAHASDDAARCEFQGRADREIRESAGLGSIQPNIRRVFATIGEGEDRRRVLLCREVDTNLDGVKDVVRTFNDKGESLREVADTNFDGKVDTWITFARGHIVKVDVDTNGDAVPDEFRYLVRGKLSRLQRDTNGDGRPDVWEIYDEGHLRRMGHDIDGDGRVDRWDRDELAERAALERELAEEQRKRTEGAAGGEGGATGGPPSPGVPSGAAGATSPQQAAPEATTATGKLP